jgi:hypothetical protein
MQHSLHKPPFATATKVHKKPFTIVISKFKKAWLRKKYTYTWLMKQKRKRVRPTHLFVISFAKNKVNMVRTKEIKISAINEYQDDRGAQNRKKKRV